MSERVHLVPKSMIEQWKAELRREKQVQPAIPLDRAIRAVLRGGERGFGSNPAPGAEVD